MTMIDLNTAMQRDPPAWAPDLVIFHNPCTDGFGAAWAAWHAWGDAPEYIGAAYGEAPPNVEGKNVLIVDFSYPKAVLETMAGSATSIVVLDHHKSAAADLGGKVLA